MGELQSTRFNLSNSVWRSRGVPDIRNQEQLLFLAFTFCWRGAIGTSCRCAVGEVGLGILRRSLDDLGVCPMSFEGSAKRPVSFAGGDCRRAQALLKQKYGRSKYQSCNVLIYRCVNTIFMCFKAPYVYAHIHVWFYRSVVPTVMYFAIV